MGGSSFLSASGNVKSSGILNATYLFQGRSLLDWRAPGGTLLARTYHYRHREHLPVLGRFAQRDRLGAGRDALRLGNSYAYLSSRPTVRLDPSGLQDEPLDSPGEDTAVSYAGEHSVQYGIVGPTGAYGFITFRYNRYTSKTWGPIEVSQDCRDPLCKDCSGTADQGPTHLELAESVRKACDAFAEAAETVRSGKVGAGAKTPSLKVLQGAVKRCKRGIAITCQCCGEEVEGRAQTNKSALDVVLGLGLMEPQIVICAPPVRAPPHPSKPWKNAAFCDDLAGGRMGRADKGPSLIIHELGHLGGSLDTPNPDAGAVETWIQLHTPGGMWVPWDDPRNAYTV